MTGVLQHKVRFGELSYGPFIHNGTIFDLLIEATEELSHELGYAAETIVAADGVPYAPVAIEASMDTYPRYEDTICIDIEPITIGERHVQLAYRFTRAADDVQFGRAAMVQITITPDGEAEPVHPSVRAGLEALEGAAREPIDVAPRAPIGDGAALSRDVVFRSPHIEGAALGYFEDYARELSICLEAWLAERGHSLRSLTDQTYPFIPVDWELTLEESINFEDQISIDGRVLRADEQAVEIAYELRRPSTDDVCIRADMTYGCFTDRGERAAFPTAALDAVRTD